MKKQKEIPVSTGIIIILAAAVILFGGAFTFQYFAIQKVSPLLQIQEIKKIKPTKTPLTSQQILNKTFPVAGEPINQTIKSISLEVENTSPGINMVDIKVSIDNNVDVDTNFSYNIPQKFNVKLTEGKHHIIVTSEKGGANMETDFNISSTKNSAALIEYWYGSYSGNPYPQPKHFSFSISQ